MTHEDAGQRWERLIAEVNMLPHYMGHGAVNLISVIEILEEYRRVEALHNATLDAPAPGVWDHDSGTYLNARPPASTTLLEEAMHLIAARPCEDYPDGYTCFEVALTEPWCAPCIARGALARLDAAKQEEARNA